MSSASPILSRLHDIGWDLWDPIGLRDVRESGCEDEYDRYLWQVVTRLKRGDSIRDVVSYLIDVETHVKGLGSSPSPSSLPRATATAVAIETYLKTRSEGPLGAA